MGTLAHDRRVKLQQMRHKLKPHHRAEINQEHINRVKKIMAHFLLSFKSTLSNVQQHFFFTLKCIKKHSGNKN